MLPEISCNQFIEPLSSVDFNLRISENGPQPADFPAVWSDRDFSFALEIAFRKLKASFYLDLIFA